MKLPVLGCNRPRTPWNAKMGESWAPFESWATDIIGTTRPEQMSNFSKK